MNFAAETGSALKRTQGPRFNRLEPVSHFSRRFQSAGKVVNSHSFLKTGRAFKNPAGLSLNYCNTALNAAINSSRVT